VYFLPAVGREKVIKIRRFSNETAIKNGFASKSSHASKQLKYLLFPPAMGGEKDIIN
jgi:hypothetical protein